MSTCITTDLRSLFTKFYKDNVLASTAVFLVTFSIFLCIYLSLALGLVILFAFIVGCVIAIVLLNHREQVGRVLNRIWNYFETGNCEKGRKHDCDVCGVSKCARHQIGPQSEPWKGLFIDNELDMAVDSFYTRILASFVESWFSLLSKNEEFVLSLKHNLREATCRLVIKLMEIDAPQLLTTKLLPCIFAHYELVQKMLHDGVPMDRLGKQFQLNECAIHPAVLNRQDELEYLRDVAKCLIPRLCNNENFDSKVFFSLVRELLSGWALLPLMDVISDPNLINLLVIVATNKSNKILKPLNPKDRVLFLERFVRKRDSEYIEPAANTAILTDQSQLYTFMQFLKKQGAVDLLRFYLDVDNLNRELLDPKVTTDPSKLSSLQQQSEKLLHTYQLMMRNDFREPLETLAEAHDDAKQLLQGKWQQAFHDTPEYFRLIYGSREIVELEDIKDVEQQGGFRLGSKLKGALRSAIDGAPLEGTEIPTVWDALHDDASMPSMNSHHHHQVPSGSGAHTSSTTPHNATIYTSVTQKLRKERGQNLDNFISSFMQSIEQKPDLGEDAVQSNAATDAKKSKMRQPQRKLTPPGRNSVFGDLFEMKRSSKLYGSGHSTAAANQSSNGIIGPSKCLVYIFVRIIKIPSILVKLLMALICVSQTTVDSIICKIIDKLIRIGLYEPRLTILIGSLEAHLFGPKQPEPSPSELLERQRQAKLRLDYIYSGLSTVIDVLQSPALNKQLMYCLFDIILMELYPELETIAKI